jgi:hypothetical protein
MIIRRARSFSLNRLALIKHCGPDNDGKDGSKRIEITPACAKILWRFLGGHACAVDYRAGKSNEIRVIVVSEFRLSEHQ